MKTAYKIFSLIFYICYLASAVFISMFVVGGSAKNSLGISLLLLLLPPVIGLLLSVLSFFKAIPFWLMIIPVLPAGFFYIYVFLQSRSDPLPNYEAVKSKPNYYSCIEGYGFDVDQRGWIFYYANDPGGTTKTVGLLKDGLLTISKNVNYNLEELERIRMTPRPGVCKNSEARDLSEKIKLVQ